MSVKDVKSANEKIIAPAREEAHTHQKNQFTVIASSWSVYAKSDTDAYTALKAWRGLRAPHRDSATDPLLLQQEADALTREEILSRYARATTASEFVAIYQPLIEQLRADIVVIQTTGLDQEALIDHLGKDVLPQLR